MKIYDDHWSRNASQAGTKNLQTYLHKTIGLKTGITLDKRDVDNRETSRKRY